MGKPRYGVARMFKVRRAAGKWAEDSRKVHFGARVTEVADGYMVRRTDYPIN